MEATKERESLSAQVAARLSLSSPPIPESPETLRSRVLTACQLPRVTGLPLGPDSGLLVRPLSLLMPQKPSQTSVTATTTAITKNEVSAKEDTREGVLGAWPEKKHSPDRRSVHRSHRSLLGSHLRTGILREGRSGGQANSGESLGTNVYGAHDVER